MTLTPRQVEVVRCIARGDSDAEIGDELGITSRTVKMHTQVAAKRLGVRERRRLPLAYFEQTGDDPWPR